MFLWIFLGGILIVIGVLRGAHALVMKRGFSYLSNLIAALLYVGFGVLVILNPESRTATIPSTLVIASLLILDGLLYIASSFVERSPNWRWLLANGALVLLFGIAIAVWQQFTHLRIWFNAISLVLAGLSGRAMKAEA